MRNVVCLFAFFFLIINIEAQHNDGQAAAYNIVGNALLGGIGAVINKKPNEVFHKVLIKGMGQGALGGYFVFESKRLVREFSNTENYAYLWPSKVLNATGNSITYNAASNRNFWERWHLDFGFNYLEYDIKKEKKFRYRILPFALYGNVNGFIRGKFDLRKTLYSGQFIFKNGELKSNRDAQPLAQTLVNTVQFDPGFNSLRTEELIAHEIIHVYQYNSYFASNAFIKKSISRWNDKSSLLKTLDKIFLTDFNYLLFVGTYKLETFFGAEYEDLYIEREARFYSSGNF